MNDELSPVTEIVKAEDIDLTLDQKVRAMALTLAVKYHADTVIKDGAMYQQYKLEGRNMRTLNTDMVLETAIVYEAFIREGKVRVSIENGEERIALGAEEGGDAA